MGIIKDFLEQLIYFSIIEGFILNYFLIKIYDFRNIKIINLIIYSIGINIIYFITVPIIRQIMLIIFTFIIILYLNNMKCILNIIKITVFFSLFLLIVEMLFSMFYEIFFQINFVNINNLNKFLIMIPIRITQLIAIKFIERRR